MLDQLEPDAILLDMKMPVMDGRELLRQYRRRPGPKAPIIVRTAAQDDKRRDAGASGLTLTPAAEHTPSR